ncbi:MAG TPA: glycerol-3-phosphate dehydrogenase/oxidase [Gammaproteobacteria bacterium]|nr:glycerol-3-phosphate dehydrogenase/oxidase [Gammaproteobacteria bacterium]
MTYDVVVIGAGIHGAGVAQAAAAAGYCTLLLEQYDRPAQGTSSKSSKLIHGGLRYLESAQFGLVRECLVERRRLLENAPQLVKLVPFHIPVYRNTRRRPWQIRLGLSLYALLGGKGFQKIPERDWNTLDGLRNDGLDAVFRYYDAQTDDALLTQAVLASAQSLGAEIRYGCELQQARCEGNACILNCHTQGKSEEIHTCTLVNAAGPWVNTVAARIQPAPEQLDIDLVQGTHLVLPGQLQHGMYYLEAPQDQRAVFAMPWQDNILLGTTEFLYQGDPGEVTPRQEETDYLLTVWNHYFKNKMGADDIIDSFAGLRVLPRSRGKAFHRTRETLLHIDTTRCPRVLSIYGGKLTSYRSTAEKIIRQLQPLLPTRTPCANTQTQALEAPQQSQRGR